jgi:hypothetical protein
MADELDRAVKEMFKQAQKQALQLAEQSIRETVELCYCSEHGQFARVTGQLTPSSADGRYETGYEVCCKSLRNQVKQRLKLHLGFE